MYSFRFCAKKIAVFRFCAKKIAVLACWISQMNTNLLRAFVAIVDAGGFTKAGIRLHRTQSTVSQQVSRLEEDVGRPLLKRNTRSVEVTVHGEQFLGYARRMLALEEEARAVLKAQERLTFIRLGIPEDFAITTLPALLKRFSARHREVCLEVICALSNELLARLAAGQLDLALVKEEDRPRSALMHWPEELRWVGPQHMDIYSEKPIPLVVFPQGCLYRNRAVFALETIGRSWRVAYESPNLSGINAAVQCGVGVTLLGHLESDKGVRRLTSADGFPSVSPAYLVLRAHRPLRGETADLADEIVKLANERSEAVTS